MGSHAFVLHKVMQEPVISVANFVKIHIHCCNSCALTCDEIKGSDHKVVITNKYQSYTKPKSITLLLLLALLLVLHTLVSKQTATNLSVIAERYILELSQCL